MNSSCRFIIFIFIFLLGCNTRENAEQVYSTSNDFTLDKIWVTELNGNFVNLEKYRGKTLFINFWATWCKPCLQEMPFIETAIKILEKENIEFLFVSDEDAEQIIAFKKGNRYDFNYVRIDNTAALNILALPTIFIFNSEGRLVFNESGSRQWDYKNNIDLIRGIIKSK